MNSWQLITNLNWPRFLGAFVFADLSSLVIPIWELALKLTGDLEESAALENLRQLAMDARQEMLELLDDATGPAGPTGPTGA